MSRFLTILFLFFFLTPSLHARRLLAAEKLASKEENSFQNAITTGNAVPPSSVMNGEDRFARRAPSLDAGLYLSALPKGTVPPSSPSKKVHGVVVDQKLFMMHLAKIDRILKSVPSPGVGH